MTQHRDPDYAVLDRAGAAMQVFYPRRDLSPAPPGAEDLHVEVEPGVVLGARAYLRDAAWPTILYFHGNGEVASDHDGIAPLYHQIGANLVVVDFRGYGKSGGIPSMATLVSDARTAAAWFHTLLDERGYGARRFVMGRSLGTQPALEVASRAAEGFAGLIVESGAGSVRRLLTRFAGDISEEEREALASAHEGKVRSIRLPALLLHGEWDELIPVEHAAELYGLLDATERELIVIPGAGHNDILWVGMEEYFRAIGRMVNAEP